MSITLIIIIITCLISYMAFKSPELFHKLKHWPYAEANEKQYYRLISSGFVHGSWIHLLINMFVFYQFGEIVEQVFISTFGPIAGTINFLFLFLATIVFADIPTLLKHRNNPSYAAVGASGGVSGIVFVYILFEPWKMLYLYAIIPIPGIVAGLLYLGYSSWASKNSTDNIDHDAHFFGALVGIAIALLLKPTFILVFIEKIQILPF
jgi:membrane associated rhomboid family serine protease